MNTSFVGRDHELRVLDERLAAVRSDGSRTVVVEGSAGMGKSALIAAFLAKLGDVQPIVVSGDEGETELDFGTCRQLLDEETATWQDPFAAGASLLRMLDDRADGSAVVLVIDDAHLADAASLRAVTFALRRLRTDHVMALLTARSETVERLPAGLLRLVDAQDGRLKLSGLNEAEVIELGASMGCDPPSRGLARRLVQHTDGSPLYLRALLAELPVDQLEHAHAPLPAPRYFASRVIASLETTSTRAQQIARAAAVLGDGASLEQVATVADAPDPASALEELQRVRILRLRASRDGWLVRFEHPLVRTSVYEDLGPATRAELHRRAADLLGGTGALTHLVAAASRPDAALAGKVEQRAIELKQAASLRAAAEMMLAAARLTPSGALADRRLLDAVELLLFSGSAAAAMTYSERIDAMPATAQRFSVQARMSWLSGRLDAAEQLAIQAWEQGHDLEPAARDAVAAMLAQLFIMRDQGAAAATWAEEALGSGRLPREQAGATRAAAALGLAISGRADEGARLLDHLDLDPAKIAPDQHRELRARGILRLITDDLRGARADLEVCSSVAHRDLSATRLTAIGALAEANYRLGDWDTSLALAEQSLSLVRDTEQFWLQGQIHAVAVLVLAGRGQWPEAEAHLAAAKQMAALLEDPATVAYADNAAVHLAMCRADSSQVLAEAARLARAERGGPHEPGILAWPVHFVAALVTVGRLAEADDELAGFEQVARDRRRRSRLAALARIRGELAAVRRQRAEARDAFEESLRLGDEAVDALERAMAHASYGMFLRRRGERRSAVEQLQLARDGLVHLGAWPFVQRCDVELMASGLNPRPPERDSISALTPQEQVVARLVCTGRTNREVADELVLSAKTVGYHLGNVYTKLGIHSRAQLMTHPDMVIR